MIAKVVFRDYIHVTLKACSTENRQRRHLLTQSTLNNQHQQSSLHMVISGLIQDTSYDHNHQQICHHSMCYQVMWSQGEVMGSLIVHWHLKHFVQLTEH